MCADVFALAVERGRIVRLPKYLQQLLVGDDRGVELNLDDFGVACCARADLLVGGVGGRAPGKAGGDRFDAGDALENRLRAPEAAAAKRGGLQFGRGVRRAGLSIHNGNKTKTPEQQAGRPEPPGRRAIRRKD